MRPGTGCQSCRSRHLKCVVAPNSAICTRCFEAGRTCEFLPRYRFRQVSHVDTASQGLRSRTELQYQSDQPWVETANPVSFVLEDGSGTEYSAEGFEGMEVDEGQRVGEDRDAGGILRADDKATLNGAENAMEADDIDRFQRTMSGLPEPSGWAPTEVPDIRHHSPGLRSYMTPASVPELTRRYVFGVTTGSVGTPFTPLGQGGGSNAASPATSLPTPGSLPSRLKLSRREAFLMHHFINKIAPWVGTALPTPDIAGSPLTVFRSTAATYPTISASRCLDVLSTSPWYYSPCLLYHLCIKQQRTGNHSTRLRSIMANAYVF